MPSNEADYYRLLGISRDAPEREIKKAYYDLARRLHPDKASSPEEASKNASDLALISQAYNTLKDARKRQEYDAKLRGRSAGGDPPASAPAPAPRKPKASSEDSSSSALSGDMPRIGDAEIRAQKKAMAQKAFVRGMQMMKQDDIKQALSFFEAAVKNDPDSDAQYHLKYAQAIMKARGSFTKAVEHAQKACEMDPYSLDFKLVLAEIHEMAGVHSKAKELYQDVLRWDPTNERAKLRLGFMKDEEDSKKGFFSKVFGSLLEKGQKK
ncbi:DnaJ domain-containing protein [bacterium]|nr:DnaJ domain-containing protein [bacterium]